MLPGGKTIMLSPSSFKLKLSAVMLCFSFVCQQSPINALTKPTLKQQAIVLAASPLIDGILQNNAELRTLAGLKRILPILKQHVMTNVRGQVVGPRAADESRAHYVKRFIKQYASSNPVLCLALGLTTANATHSFWTASASNIIKETENKLRAAGRATQEAAGKLRVNLTPKRPAPAPVPAPAPAPVQSTNSGSDSDDEPEEPLPAQPLR